MLTNVRMPIITKEEIRASSIAILIHEGPYQTDDLHFDAKVLIQLAVRLEKLVMVEIEAH